MSPRTLAPAPPTDKRFWRRILARVHPDGGGDHDLFLFAQSVYEYVAGDAIEPVPTGASRQPPEHPKAGERIDFTDAFNRAESFTELTEDAVAIASLAADIPEACAWLLRLLADCREAGPGDVAAYRSQHQGATYKQLAYIAHLSGMGRGLRQEWYRVAESIPLAQRHAGHIIKRLQGNAA